MKERTVDNLVMKACNLMLWICILSCVNNSARKKQMRYQEGKVIKIVDGDTYDILINGNKTRRIRMEGIGAPEKGMPFYKVAKNYLGRLCFKKNIRLAVEGKDLHGRTIAYSYLDDGRELSHEMVKAGLAWYFRKYSSDSSLSRLEDTARIMRLGLWKEQRPMAPWEDRKLHREGISTKDSFKVMNKQF
ncbi:MAG: thermonuclease family protein [Ginsengibacter sp.]